MDMDNPIVLDDSNDQVPRDVMDIHFPTVEGYINHNKEELCDAFFGTYCQVSIISYTF